VPKPKSHSSAEQPEAGVTRLVPVSARLDVKCRLARGSVLVVVH
jgi:hypothetical protein